MSMLGEHQGGSLLSPFRKHANYSNIVASLALFVAIGGTSYAAIALPKDSVGKRQLKSRAVGSSELRRASVGSRAIKNGGIEAIDLSAATKASLHGAQGPQGPPGPAAVSLRAAINAASLPVAGSPVGTSSTAPNKTFVSFQRSVAGCVPVASLARNAGGPPADPTAGRIVVAIEGTRVAVQTYRSDGAPAFLPFNLIVAC
jgi:hypothetical protein